VAKPLLSEYCGQKKIVFFLQLKCSRAALRRVSIQESTRSPALPFINIDNTRLFYRLEGRPNLPVLVLSHSLGCDHGMWSPQMPDLLEHFQVLRFDTRGHGASDAPGGDYSIERFGRDVLGLLDRFSIQQVAFCGLSMGGAVGQWVAVNAPARLTSLVLANSSAQFSGETLEARRRTVLESGMNAIVDAVIGRFFSPQNQAGTEANSVRSVLLGTSPLGYAGCCAALRDFNYKSLLGKILAPTLVIVGERDASTPWAEHGKILAREVPNAQAIHLPTAHLSNLERPRSFTAALLEFLQTSLDDEVDPIEPGLRVRREVLGDEHVERSIANATDLTHDFQSLITRFAWGSVWARPGLDRRTRRLVTLATMAALGRWEEFRLHLRAGVAHGLEPSDIKELLLQVAVYAGLPAANTGFHIASEELQKLKGR
jgi:3-oxoadipate enol-lactonase/4-carboxymuconolactone decarboxylase